MLMLNVVNGEKEEDDNGSDDLIFFKIFFPDHDYGGTPNPHLGKGKDHHGNDEDGSKQTILARPKVPG